MFDWLSFFFFLFFLFWNEKRLLTRIEANACRPQNDSQQLQLSVRDWEWSGFRQKKVRYIVSVPVIIATHLQQFWFVMPIFRKKRSFDLSCHFFGWSFCNFEKQFWRELSNNRASYYYWTRWVDMLQVAGLTERTFLPGPKLEWFEHNWCYICWQSFFTCITGARNPFLNTYQKVSFKRCAMMN